MSKPTKFTKGPWRTGRTDMQSYDGATGEPFASVYCTDDRAPMHLGQQLPYDIARTFGDECKANAALIAASPELYEALEECLPQLRWADCHGSRCPELLAKIEKALAKARGESL